jgi:hypothetical protein
MAGREPTTAYIEEYERSLTTTTTTTTTTEQKNFFSNKKKENSTMTMIFMYCIHRKLTLS